MCMPGIVSGTKMGDRASMATTYTGRSYKDGSSSEVTVAVCVGLGKGNANTMHALNWTLQTLLSNSPDNVTLLLLHVTRPLLSIPTPLGNFMAVARASSHALASHKRDLETRTQNLINPFQILCMNKKVRSETVLLEHENVATVILQYVSSRRISKLVIGKSCRNFITRRLKGDDTATIIARELPANCSLYVISKAGLSSISPGVSNRFSCCASDDETFLDANYLNRPNTHDNYEPKQTRKTASLETNTRLEIVTQTLDRRKGSTRSRSTLMLPESIDGESRSFTMIDSEMNSEVSSRERTSNYNSDDDNQITHKAPLRTMKETKNMGDIQMELERLKTEVHDTKKIYMESLDNQHKVKGEFMDQSQHLGNLKSGVYTSNVKRRLNTSMALQFPQGHHELEYGEKVSTQRYRRYTFQQLEMATESFAAANKIGEGRYGDVFKGNLDHTRVAIKLLRENAEQHKSEFQQEVEVLTRVHHPYIVMLLGACPEHGGLVYEYMENGSLEDMLLHKNSNNMTPSLPWFVRFRIAFQIACALNFLHTTEPEAIVHRDLKPANILLDENMVCKVADVGLSKFVGKACSEEYRNTMLAGTLLYIDPEYQRTGVVKPKSDVYAMGLIMLQLLTGTSAVGLIDKVDKAIQKGSFAFEGILDSTAGDWPLSHTIDICRLALRCTSLQRKHRPDLNLDVLPQLHSLVGGGAKKDNAHREYHKLYKDSCYANSPPG